MGRGERGESRLRVYDDDEERVTRNQSNPLKNVSGLC